MSLFLIDNIGFRRPLIVDKYHHGRMFCSFPLETGFRTEFTKVPVKKFGTSVLWFSMTSNLIFIFFPSGR